MPEIPQGAYDALLADRAKLAEVSRRARLAMSSIADMINPDVHTPDRVGAYLAARGWVVEERGRVACRWRNDELTCWTLAPAIPGAPDYGSTLAVLVYDQAQIRDVGELQVLADIADTHICHEAHQPWQRRTHPVPGETRMAAPSPADVRVRTTEEALLDLQRLTAVLLHKLGGVVDITMADLFDVLWDDGTPVIVQTPGDFRTVETQVHLCTADGQPWSKRGQR